MARKTRTRVEEETETVTKIACDECDERYENRGIRGRQGVNTLVLDASAMYKGGVRHHWFSFYWDKSRTRTSGSRYKIRGYDAVDLCVEPCFAGTFMDGDEHEADDIDEELHLNIEVEETEYEVVEEEEEVYLCDSCGKDMGNEHDHEVSLNPRIKSLRVGRSDTVGNVETNDIGDVTRLFGDKTVIAKRDDYFHICCGCADELFGGCGDSRDLGLFDRIRQFF